MASNDDNNNSPPSPTARRASTASQRLSEFFGRSPTATTGTPPFPGPIATAAHQANQKRRMSIATVGLGGSPSQNSPFGSHTRQDSFSSNGSGQGDSAIDDSGDAAPPLGSSPTFRRLSFGGRAMSQMSGSVTNGEGSGFNWSNEMRNRAQRSSSITSPTGAFSAARFPQKATSVSTPAAAPPPPPAVKQQTPPDHFQERILKGDFYMD